MHQPLPVMFAAALAAALGAGAAAAQCLDAAALARGVVVRMEGGDWTTLRRGGDGYLTVEEHYASGEPTMRLRAHRGLFVVDEVQVDAWGQPVPETRVRVEYPQDPAGLPEPVEGGSWQGQTLNVLGDGSTRPEKTTFHFSATAPLELPGCSYEALLADLRYDWGQAGGMSLQYLYLPALGAAVILSSHLDGEEMRLSAPVALEPLVK